jgi:hypothetical protein
MMVSGMGPESWEYVIIFISSILAIIMLPLTWVSRNIWKNKERTRLFALIGIVAMIVFIVTIWDYLPD